MEIDGESLDAAAVHLAHCEHRVARRDAIADHRQPGPGILPPEGLASTDRACYEVLSLPCYPELTDAEADVVIAACNRWQPVIRS